MLVVFGELFECGGAERIAGCGQLRVDFEGQGDAPEFLFERSDVPQRAEEQIVGETPIHRLTEESQCVFVLLGLAPPAR